MSTASNIEWTDATWNPVVGCTRVSAGCDHCYAVTMSHRLEAMGQAKYAGLTVLSPRGERHFSGVVRCDESALTIPLRWRKPRRVFVNSMSDLFHRDVPFEFVDRVFAVMALCPQHTFQVLTKRPERMAEYTGNRARAISVNWRSVTSSVRQTAYPQFTTYSEERALWVLERMLLPNVWLGTSCEDQDAADERIPHLLRCPAAVRFLSCEPLLGLLDLCNEQRDLLRPLRSMFRDRPPIEPGIDWVIVGGESGANARPCSVNWINAIETQCHEAHVPLFVKQLGSNSGYTSSPFREDFVAVTLHDRKGADPAEWPVHLQSKRQMPREGGAA